MKKNKIRKVLFNLMFFPFILTAQVEWAPIGAEWHYVFREGIYPNYGTFYMKSLKDTLIDNKNCRKLEKWLITSDRKKTIHYGFEYLYNPVAENKVYRLLGGKFYLLYDFNKKVGDTIKIGSYSSYYTGGKIDSIRCVIDSTGTLKLSENQVLKTQTLRKINEKPLEMIFDGKVIEKIGNLRYFFPENTLQCDGGCPDPLICYNDNLLKFNALNKASCDSFYVYTSLPKNYISDNIIISPSPCSDYLNVENLSSEEDYTIQIYSLSGSLIFKQEVLNKRILQIDLSKHNPGIYLLQFKTSDGCFSKKFLKL